MINILLVNLAISCVASFAVNTNSPQIARKPTPFYCNMNALSADDRAELPKVLDRLIAAAPSVKELSNGYELSFKQSEKLFPLAAQWTSAESRCCPFFDFSLTVARFGGPMRVRITGPDGVKAFISEDLPKLHRLMSKTGR